LALANADFSFVDFSADLILRPASVAAGLGGSRCQDWSFLIAGWMSVTRATVTGGRWGLRELGRNGRLGHNLQII
jgi:hypothetical protein